MFAVSKLRRGDPRVSNIQHALVLAPTRAAERVITGLTLGERARRVAIRAGLSADHVHVVRSPDELPALADVPLVVIRATDQVVAADLVDPLRPAEPGARLAIDGAGAYAGAVRVDASHAADVIAALRADWAGGEERAARAAGAEPVTVGPRARHRAGTPEEVRAARAWQWALVNKPLDAFLTRRFWRPCARPLTRLFLHLPLTPNMISVACIIVSVIGGVVAMSPRHDIHLLGIAIYFFAALLDNVDGEVARLRLESSRAGGWLDTIGDDIARFAVILAVFFHVRGDHPDWPVGWLAAFTIVNALIANALLYWWCIFVGKTYNNQEYAKAIGAAPHEAATEKSWKRAIADFGAQAARRDALDVVLLVCAVIDFQELTMAGLLVGQAAGLVIILSIHFKIVAQRRSDAALRRGTPSASSR